MSGARFGVLLALAAAAVAAGAFVVGLQVLDDDAPGRPPTGGSDPGPDDADADAGDEGPAAPSTSVPAVTDEALPSPSWVLVISSEGDEARARAVAEEVATAGHPAGLLRSDAYPSLNPGFWVAYAGPYPDAAAAAEAEPAVEEDGWSGAYVRCVGAVEDCGGPDQGGDADQDDDDDD